MKRPRVPLLRVSFALGEQNRAEPGKASAHINDGLQQARIDVKADQDRKAGKASPRRWLFETFGEILNHFHVYFPFAIAKALALTFLTRRNQPRLNFN